MRLRIVSVSSNASASFCAGERRRSNSNCTCCASLDVSGESGFMDLILARLLQQLAGDDELLDFGGAFVDAQGADVAVEALDDRATHEARAAVDLYRAVDD